MEISFRVVANTSERKAPFRSVATFGLRGNNYDLHHATRSARRTCRKSVFFSFKFPLNVGWKIRGKQVFSPDCSLRFLATAPGLSARDGQGNMTDSE